MMAESEVGKGMCTPSYHQEALYFPFCMFCLKAFRVQQYKMQRRKVFNKIFSTFLLHDFTYIPATLFRYFRYPVPYHH